MGPANSPANSYLVESRSFDGRSVWQWEASFVGRAPSLLILHSNEGDGITSEGRNHPWPADTLALAHSRCSGCGPVEHASLQ